MDDPLLYHSIVGVLQYVTITRPELSYSVNKVCPFMAQPLLEHWKAVKCILRYLKGTLACGCPIALTHGYHTLNAYCDADWASDLDDRQSTSGACIFFGSNLVSWWSKKQPIVSCSSVEAEYRSLAIIVSEKLWS
ncbi:uncharacterized protein LOC114191207 [Vigna unguiculata]|uniref:uncharacterized protein LOC114191207 n=1 Tax=Vigna unguiculata TaxID=3917 RepID=UPI0010167EAB|nr:uncharacterized protein LOC114191207 [Vigna unguiculata]